MHEILLEYNHQLRGNLLGDVIAIYDTSGNRVGAYTYGVSTVAFAGMDVGFDYLGWWFF